MWRFKNWWGKSTSISLVCQTACSHSIMVRISLRKEWCFLLCFSSRVAWPIMVSCTCFIKVSDQVKLAVPWSILNTSIYILEGKSVLHKMSASAPPELCSFCSFCALCENAQIIAEPSWDPASQLREHLSVNWSILVVCDQFTPQCSGEMMKRKTEAEFFYLTKWLTVTHDLQSGYNQAMGVQRCCRAGSQLGNQDW